MDEYEIKERVRAVIVICLEMALKNDCLYFLSVNKEQYSYVNRQTAVFAEFWIISCI